MNSDPPDAAERDANVLIRDVERVTRAVASAQRDAVRRQRLLGQPIVVFRDGLVVEEPAPDLDAQSEGVGPR